MRLPSIAVLIIGPVLALVALDRAFVLREDFWSWAVRETPAELHDPLRFEGLVRTAPGDGRHVFLLGNSTAEDAFDTALLDERFEDRGLRFERITVGAATALTLGFIANDLAALEPAGVVLMLGPPSLRDKEALEQPFAYDLRAVPALFSAREVLSDLEFHIEGAAAQANLFARHRRSLQRNFLVWSGATDWLAVRAAHGRVRLNLIREGTPWSRWVADTRHRDHYPNPNTRAVSYLARTVQQAGGRFILVEVPNPRSTHELIGSRRLEHTRSYLRELAEADGFPFVSAEEHPDIPISDYKDMIHLKPSGQRQFTEYIAGVLRELL